MDFVVAFLLALGALLACAGVGGASEASTCPLQCVCETRPWYTPQSVYHQARTVDCNELRLQRVPGNISSDTQVLLLQSNNISSITAELQSLRNLTELDLSQNHFTQLGSVALSSLSRLVTLYLEENHIEELEDFGLTNLTCLEELYINHNRISSIGPRAFAGLSNLLRLHLNSNRLAAINSRWFESLPSLEILMIGENPILGLEDKNFLPLSGLHSLVLAGMGLGSVPSAVFHGLDYLESLSFYDNQLRSVPRDALKALPNLKFLDLNRNPIGRIQQGDFQNFQHLEELSLNNMEDLLVVERLAFQNLQGIVKLELTNNPQLSHIHPQAFRHLPSLRTLLLHNNQLGLLSGAVFSSLPSLEEVSLHSNPLRCDCCSSWGPHLGNRSHLKVLESPATLCSSPHQLAGRELREVVAAGWGGTATDSCLPQISTFSFPPAINVSAGQPLTLECWADAEPAPQFYWVTPAGDKVSSEAMAAPVSSKEGRGLSSRRRRHHISESGVLVVERSEPSDAGIYTCVAWNREGADTRSVSVFVDSVGGQAGDLSWWDGAPSREQSWNLSNTASSLVVVAKVVDDRSVVLEWKLFPGRETLSSGEDQQASQLNLPQWISATVHINNPQISYTTKVPVDVQEYNLTHLLPATEYRVCLTISSSPPAAAAAAAAAASPSPGSSPSPSTSTPFSPPIHTSCVNVTTKEADFSVEAAASRRRGVAVAAAMGSIFALSIMALLVVYIGRRAQQHQSCGHSLKKYIQHATSIPLNELYPPLITLWDNETEKDKEEKEDEERGGGEKEERAGGSQIDTNKTYMW